MSVIPSLKIRQPEQDKLDIPFTIPQLEGEIKLEWPQSLQGSWHWEERWSEAIVTEERD